MSDFGNNCEIIRITLAGSGYVGMSLATLLAQPHLNTEVTVVDIVEERVKKINDRISPMQDVIL